MSVAVATIITLTGKRNMATRSTPRCGEQIHLPKEEMSGDANPPQFEGVADAQSAIDFEGGAANEEELAAIGQMRTVLKASFLKVPF
jgi:hypothetical protein